MGGNWAIWLILLIPVAVSILSLLFRATKEEPRRPGRMRPGEGPVAGRPQRRSVSDIDQFLEEINRRRREAAERRRAAEAPSAPVRPAPPEDRPPLPPPVRARPLPPPVVKPPRRPERERQEPPRLREQEKIIIAEVVPSARQSGPAMPAPEAAAQVAVATPRPASPALTQLLPLLRSRQGLRTAFLLQEILGRPVCRRGNPVPLFRQQ